MIRWHGSLQAEIAAIKLIVGGINSRTKGNAGSSDLKVTENSRHKSDSDILVYTMHDTAKWPPLERDCGEFGAGFDRGM